MRQVSPRLRALSYCCTFLLLTLAALLMPTTKAAEWVPAARFPLNANVQALAGSMLAVVSGVAATNTNPAGLAVTGNSEVQAAHMAPMFNTNLDGFAAAFNGSSFGWGIGVQQLVAEKITKTDAIGATLGLFDYSEGAITLAVGKRIGSSNYGAAVSHLWQTADNAYNGGAELRAGVQQTLAPGWQAGVIVTRLWCPSACSATPPVKVDGGISYSGKFMAAHLGATSEGSSLAVNVRPVDGVDLRVAGVNANGAFHYRLGLGVIGGNVALDYAYLPGSSGDMPQQLSLGHLVSVQFAL